MFSKLSSAVVVFRFLLEIVKEVRELMKMVEEDDIGKGNGEKKKEIVLRIIGNIYDTADDFVEIPLDRETVINFADNMVEVIHDLFSVIGVFR